MRLAFVILAHKRPDQLIRLVDRLTGPQIDFFIHVDRRTDDSTFALMKEPFSDRRDVSFVSRHVCRWGRFGYVRGTLGAIGEIVRRGEDYDYVVLLSGQDYPIKPMHHIVGHLGSHRGTSFMEHFPLPRKEWSGRGGMERFQYRGGRLLGRVWRFPDRRLTRWLPLRTDLPGNLPPHAGSTWWLLESPCIDYVHRFVEENPDIVDGFARARNPAESFFQMILLTSPMATRIRNDDLHYVDWSEDADHPEILRMHHLPALRDSPNLFARKFDVSVDPEILDAVDAQLLAEG